MSDKPRFLYAIATVRDGRPSSPVKIGISAMPYARMAEMQTGSPTPLMMVGMLLAPNRSVARAAEQFIHFCHPDRQVHGEWLNISPWYAAGLLGEFLSQQIDQHFGSSLGATDDPSEPSS